MPESCCWRRMSTVGVISSSMRFEGLNVESNGRFLLKGVRRTYLGWKIRFLRTTALLSGHCRICNVREMCSMHREPDEAPGKKILEILTRYPNTHLLTHVHAQENLLESVHHTLPAEGRRIIYDDDSEEEEEEEEVILTQDEAENGEEERSTERRGVERASGQVAIASSRLPLWVLSHSDPRLAFFGSLHSTASPAWPAAPQIILEPAQHFTKCLSIHHICSCHHIQLRPGLSAERHARTVQSSQGTRPHSVSLRSHIRALHQTLSLGLHRRRNGDHVIFQGERPVGWSVNAMVRPSERSQPPPNQTEGLAIQPSSTGIEETTAVLP